MDALLTAIDRLSHQLRDAGFEEVSYEEELEFTGEHAEPPPPAPTPAPTPVPGLSYYVPGGWWVFVQEPPRGLPQTAGAIGILARENAQLREEIASFRALANNRNRTSATEYRYASATNFADSEDP